MIRQPFHRGTSLMELMVVMTVSSTLLVIAIGWIQQSMRLSSLAKARHEHHDSVLRLSRQFRDDVHRSVSIEQSSPQELKLSGHSDILVHYRFADGRIYREATSQEATGQDAPQKTHSQFHFLPGAAAQWRRTGSIGQVELILNYSSASLGKPNNPSLQSGVGFRMVASSWQKIIPRSDR